jgi:autotransporter translocation and assembly factor TamB
MSPLVAIKGDGSADGQGTARTVRTRSFTGDGAASGTGTALISPVRGFSADGSATGTGSGVMNATKRFVVGIKDSIEDKLQFGTR